MSKNKMFSTHHDLAQEKREKVIEILNQNLANTFDLASQVKQAHWNVKGMQFIALHELFDTLYGRLNDQVDMIAERVTALGGTALGTVRLAASQSKITEYPLTISAGKDHLQALVERYGMHAASIREAIDICAQFADADTQDLFTEVSRDVDKDLWFLEAHIQEAL